MPEHDDNQQQNASGNAPALDSLIRSIQGLVIELDALPRASVENVDVADSLARIRLRLMDDPSGSSSLTRFRGCVATMLDIEREKADELLQDLEDQSRWVDGPAPGVRISHVSGGPAVENCVAGFVSIEPGAEFPEHMHLGEELVLVLSGTCVEAGTEVRTRAGEISVGAPGRSHALYVPETSTEPVVFLTVIDQGVQIGDLVIDPQSELL